MPTLHKLMAPLFGVALLIAAAPTSRAGYYTGNEMLRHCKDTGPREAASHPGAFSTCLGYLSAVSDAEDVWAGAGFKARAFCIPEGTTLEQLRRVFLRHMDQEPEYWHFAATALAVVAFGDAWPCAD